MSEMELAIIMQTVMTFIMVLGVLVVLFRQGVPAADTMLSEGIQSRLDDRRFIQELEDRYKALNGQQQMVFQTMLAFMQITSPLTPIKSDDKIAEMLKDIVTPGDPAEPVKDAPEPTFITETLTYNSELEGALDGTVDTGSDHRYQRRPPGWLVHWVAHVEHKTPPFINDVADGFRAELAFIAGQVGYVTSGVLDIGQGTYVVKAVVDANMPNPPENASDIVLAAALVREDGTIHQTLPEQPLAGWQGETTYLVPVKVEKGGLFRLAVYANLRYPTVKDHGSLTFKDIRLETEAGDAGDYVVVG